MTYILPALPYSTSSLEPFYDKATLEIHYNKHHAGYVAKLNDTLQFYPLLANYTVEELLENINSLPAVFRSEVAHNAGGHANHSLFWRSMTPQNESATFGDLAQAIPNTFGSFNNFKTAFTELSLGIFGSGWVWLTVGTDSHLNLRATPNQESPLLLGEKPILCLDLWEHAYYLKFQNRRIEWIESWWNLVNWREVSALYVRTISGATLEQIYSEVSQPMGFEIAQ